MNLHHGGPISYVGSRYKRSVPANITRTRKKNAAKSGCAFGTSATCYRALKVWIKRPAKLDTRLHLQCKSLAQAKTCARLFLETCVYRFQGRWWVRCV